MSRRTQEGGAWLRKTLAPTSTVTIRHFHCCKVLFTCPNLLGVRPALRLQAWGQLSQVPGTNYSQCPVSALVTHWLQKPCFHFLHSHCLLNLLI